MLNRISPPPHTSYVGCLY